MTEFLIIDGSYGEGGGQILRSSLSLSAITGRPVRIENLRANRNKPGLAAQHLTSVRAAAMLCSAEMKGAELGSQALQFIPRTPVRSGDYFLDVAQAREGGSSGAAMLVLQTLLLPLALTTGVSTVTLRGGTHVNMSPSYDYVHDVWLPTLARMGMNVELSLVRSGWYPVGQGQVKLRIMEAGKLLPLRLEHRGALVAVTGRALAANLPAHICERMASHARDLLEQAGISAEIEAVVLKAACPGAGLYLTAHYENCLAGFSAQGKRGKPAEQVAEEACSALLYHYRSGAALEQHLADQLILPAALCRDESMLGIERISSHIVTNAWVVERFGLARIDIAPAADGTGVIKILANR
ncbi:RNA 3'-terminal phosphate cyclase [Methylobacter sp.]|uniref:RNA 3'-terminal phosphate cyclase n=1 Tax=Methylobacter sp. TaxID=2051955 RepID=UPI002FDE1DC0